MCFLLLIKASTPEVLECLDCLFFLLDLASFLLDLVAFFFFFCDLK
jgi:hypothetical protein